MKKIESDNKLAQEQNKEDVCADNIVEAKGEAEQIKENICADNDVETRGKTDQRNTTTNEISPNIKDDNKHALVLRINSKKKEKKKNKVPRKKIQ